MALEGAIMIENQWQLQDAKNKFSNLVEKAQSSGPQIVTKHGRETVVVLSIEEYKKFINPQKCLVQFLRSSPLASTELDVTRTKELPRDLEL
jgi:prevent-host-death family protein